MAKTMEQIKASGLAMDIQEFTSERPECNDMTVEDFVFYCWIMHKEIYRIEEYESKRTRKDLSSC